MRLHIFNPIGSMRAVAQLLQGGGGTAGWVQYMKEEKEKYKRERDECDENIFHMELRWDTSLSRVGMTAHVVY